MCHHIRCIAIILKNKEVSHGDGKKNLRYSVHVKCSRRKTNRVANLAINWGSDRYFSCLIDIRNMLILLLYHSHKFVK